MWKRIKEFKDRIIKYLKLQLFYFKFYRSKEVKDLNYAMEKELNVINSYNLVNSTVFSLENCNEYLNMINEKNLFVEYGYDFYRKIHNSIRVETTFINWFLIPDEVDDGIIRKHKQDFSDFVERTGELYEMILLYQFENGKKHYLHDVIENSVKCVSYLVDNYKRVKRKLIWFRIKNLFVFEK